MEATLPLHIRLTESEQQLFDQIDFSNHAGYNEAIVSGEASRQLMESLLERNAIPSVRYSYFFEDPYPGSHGSTHLQVFKSNLQGRNLFEDSNFIEGYLRYFIFGPDLPKAVMEEFCQIVNDGDIEIGTMKRLKAVASKESRRAGRQVYYKTGDEFYKLSLECDLDRSMAEIIRRAAMQAR
jgi:hypothetical protein